MEILMMIFKLGIFLAFACGMGSMVAYALMMFNRLTVTQWIGNDAFIITQLNMLKNYAHQLGKFSVSHGHVIDDPELVKVGEINTGMVSRIENIVNMISDPVPRRAFFRSLCVANTLNIIATAFVPLYAILLIKSGDKTQLTTINTANILFLTIFSVSTLLTSSYLLSHSFTQLRTFDFNKRFRVFIYSGLDFIVATIMVLTIYSDLDIQILNHPVNDSTVYINILLGLIISAKSVFVEKSDLYHTLSIFMIVPSQYMTLAWQGKRSSGFVDAAEYIKSNMLLSYVPLIFEDNRISIDRKLPELESRVMVDYYREMSIIDKNKLMIHLIISEIGSLFIDTFDDYIANSKNIRIYVNEIILDAIEQLLAADKK